MEFNNPDDAMRAVASVLNSIENEQLVQAFQNILLQGEAIAKRECPVDQGPLRADIHSEMVETRDRLEGAIGNKLKYAPYVHNGTGIYAVNGDGRKTSCGNSKACIMFKLVNSHIIFIEFIILSYLV